MSHRKRAWRVVGVPIDCVGNKPDGAKFGTELSPAVLREAGLVSVFGPDVIDDGDLDVRIDRGAGRDPLTGIIGIESLRRTTNEISLKVLHILGDNDRPVLFGGCCSLLPGAFLGLIAHFDAPVGLAYVDGHMDLYTGETSPTGEFADMIVATLLGLGTDRMFTGESTLLSAEHLTYLGYRDHEEALSHGSILPGGFNGQAMDFNLAKLRKNGVAASVKQAANVFQIWEGRFWLHLDFDVLNPKVFPATDYLMDDGLDWHELCELLAPLVHSPCLVGMSLACYNPEKDPERSCARDIVANLAKIFA